MRCAKDIQAHSPGPPGLLANKPQAGSLRERRPVVPSLNDTPVLAERVHCIRCNTAMAIRTAAGFCWYECGCPRRIAVEDLNGIVLGLAYEHCRQLGDREFLTIDDESAMIDRLVVAVRVGLDWAHPTVDWRGDATHAANAGEGANGLACNTDQ